MNAPTADVNSQSMMHRLATSGIVAVVRLDDAGALVPLANALALGGVYAIEVTLTTPGAITGIATLKAAARDAAVPWLVGAGSVRGASSARESIEAGADFVVSPVFVPAVLGACRERDVLAIPGAFTPTECVTAVDAGAQMVKLFPAQSLGTRFLRDVRAPLPELRVMPTGGIGIGDVGGWISAGATAVGLGSALVPPAAVAAARWSEITALATEAMAQVTSARGRRS